MVQVFESKSHRVNEIINGTISRVIYSQYLKYFFMAGNCNLAFGCHLTLYGQICMLFKNISGLEIKKLIGYHEPSFKVDHFWKVHSTYRNYLVCGDVGSHQFPDGQYYIEYMNDSNLPLIGKYTGELTDFVFVTTEIIQDGFKKNYIVLKDYTVAAYVYIKRTILFIRQHFYREKYNYSLGWIACVSIIYDGHCDDDYYGKNCWFRCSSNTRQTCTCKKQISNDQELNCTIICAEGYTYRIVHYWIDGVIYSVKVCDVINVCSIFASDCYDICLSVNNVSEICIYPYYIFTSKNESKNITSLAFYEDELINLTLAYEYYTKEFLDATEGFHITLDTGSQIFYGGAILELTYTGHHFIVRGFDYDRPYNFSFSIYIHHWEKVFWYYRIFIIYRVPSHIFISRSGTDAVMDNFIVLNEDISCNSSVEPHYIALIYWNSSSFNFSDPFHNNQIYDKFSKLEFFVLQCTVFCMIYERPNINMSHRVFLRTKIYDKFKWTVKKDVIDNANNVQCIAILFINHTLDAYQIYGEQQVPFNGTFANFKKAGGGCYGFFCVLKTELNHIFTRTLYFNYLQIPSYVCFYFYPKVPGTLIQCGHDGYFEDDYIILISFYALQPDPVLIADGERSVKIPYNVKSKMYKVVCQVKSQFTDTIVHEDSVTSLLLLVAEYTYKFTDMNYKCRLNYPYIQYPDINKYLNNNTIDVHHLIFYETENKEDMFSPTAVIIIIICTIFILPTCIAFLLIRGNKVIGGLDENDALQSKRLTLCQNALLSYIELKANGIVGFIGPPKEFQKYFQNKRFLFLREEHSDNSENPFFDQYLDTIISKAFFNSQNETLSH